jgi:hypothetical protein
MIMKKRQEYLPSLLFPSLPSQRMPFLPSLLHIALEVLVYAIRKEKETKDMQIGDGSKFIFIHRRYCHLHRKP